MSQTLLTTKVRAPKSRPNLVERPRLREALDRGEGRKLTLVSAPAGFGKTTLLVEWLMERWGNERSVVWVSLDESDNDPARTWTPPAASTTPSASVARASATREYRRRRRA